MLFTFLLLLITSFAQKAVVEEYVIDIYCESAVHAIQHYREVTTIQNVSLVCLFV